MILPACSQPKNILNKTLQLYNVNFPSFHVLAAKAVGVSVFETGNWNWVNLSAPEIQSSWTRLSCTDQDMVTVGSLSEAVVRLILSYAITLPMREFHRRLVIPLAGLPESWLQNHQLHIAPLESHQFYAAISSLKLLPFFSPNLGWCWWSWKARDLHGYIIILFDFAWVLSPFWLICTCLYPTDFHDLAGLGQYAEAFCSCQTFVANNAARFVTSSTRSNSAAYWQWLSHIMKTS